MKRIDIRDKDGHRTTTSLSETAYDAMVFLATKQGLNRPKDYVYNVMDANPDTHNLSCPVKDQIILDLLEIVTKEV